MENKNKNNESEKKSSNSADRKPKFIIRHSITSEKMWRTYRRVIDLLEDEENGIKKIIDVDSQKLQYFLDGRFDILKIEEAHDIANRAKSLVPVKISEIFIDSPESIVKFKEEFCDFLKHYTLWGIFDKSTIGTFFFSVRQRFDMFGEFYDNPVWPLLMDVSIFSVSPTVEASYKEKTPTYLDFSIYKSKDHKEKLRRKLRYENAVPLDIENFEASDLYSILCGCDYETYECSCVFFACLIIEKICLYHYDPELKAYNENDAEIRSEVNLMVTYDVDSGLSKVLGLLLDFCKLGKADDFYYVFEEEKIYFSTEEYFYHICELISYYKMVTKEPDMSFYTVLFNILIITKNEFILEFGRRMLKITFEKGEETVPGRNFLAEVTRWLETSMAANFYQDIVLDDLTFDQKKRELVFESVNLARIRHLSFLYFHFDYSEDSAAYEDSDTKYLRMLYLDNGNIETGAYRVYNKKTYDLKTFENIVEKLSKIKEQNSFYKIIEWLFDTDLFYKNCDLVGYFSPNTWIDHIDKQCVRTYLSKLEIDTENTRAERGHSELTNELYFKYPRMGELEFIAECLILTLPARKDRNFILAKLMNCNPNFVVVFFKTFIDNDNKEEKFKTGADGKVVYNFSESEKCFIKALKKYILNLGCKFDKEKLKMLRNELSKKGDFDFRTAISTEIYTDIKNAENLIDAKEGFLLKIKDNKNRIFDILISTIEFLKSIYSTKILARGFRTVIKTLKKENKNLDFKLNYELDFSFSKNKPEYENKIKDILKFLETDNINNKNEKFVRCFRLLSVFLGDDFVNNTIAPQFLNFIFGNKDNKGRIIHSSVWNACLKWLFDTSGIEYDDDLSEDEIYKADEILVLSSFEKLEPECIISRIEKYFDLKNMRNVKDRTERRLSNIYNRVEEFDKQNIRYDLERISGLLEVFFEIKSNKKIFEIDKSDAFKLISDRIKQKSKSSDNNITDRIVKIDKCSCQYTKDEKYNKKDYDLKKIEKIKRKIEHVNLKLKSLYSRSSLFSENAEFQRVDIEDHVYGLPVLKHGAEVKNRESLSYPFTGYNSELQNNKNKISGKEIFDNIKISEMTLSSNDFCEVPRGRALFFAATKIRFEDSNEFDSYFSEEIHFKKLFDDEFKLKPIKIGNSKIDAKCQDKKYGDYFLNPFWLKSSVSRKYGRISSLDFFPNADNNYCKVNEELRSYSKSLLHGNKGECFWSKISELLASRCSGEVLTLTGNKKKGSDYYFDIELPILLENKKVTSITEVNIKYPELPARIIIPNNSESQKNNIAIFTGELNNALRYLLKNIKDSVIVIDFGISDYKCEEYENLCGNKKETVFLNVGKFLNKKMCNDGINFNKAVGEAIIEYLEKDKYKSYVAEIKKLLKDSTDSRENKSDKDQNFKNDFSFSGKHENNVDISNKKIFLKPKNKSGTGIQIKKINFDILNIKTEKEAIDVDNLKEEEKLKSQEIHNIEIPDKNIVLNPKTQSRNEIQENKCNFSIKTEKDIDVDDLKKKEKLKSQEINNSEIPDKNNEIQENKSNFSIKTEKDIDVDDLKKKEKLKSQEINNSEIPDKNNEIQENKSNFSIKTEKGIDIKELKEEEKLKSQEIHNSKLSSKEIVLRAKSKFNAEVQAKNHLNVKKQEDIKNLKKDSDLIKIIYSECQNLYSRAIKENIEDDENKIDEMAKNILDYRKLENYFYLEDDDPDIGDNEKKERLKISEGNISDSWKNLLCKYLELEPGKQVEVKSTKYGDNYVGGAMEFYSKFLTEKKKTIKFFDIYNDEKTDELKRQIGSSYPDGNCFIYSLLCQLQQDKFDEIVKYVHDNNAAYKYLKDILVWNKSNNCNESDFKFSGFLEAATYYNSKKKYKLVEYANYIRAYISMKLLEDYLKNDLKKVDLYKCLVDNDKNINLSELVEVIEQKGIKIKVVNENINEILNTLGKNIEEKDVFTGAQQNTDGFIQANEKLVSIISDLTQSEIFVYNASFDSDEKEMGFVYQTPHSKKGNYNLSLGEATVADIKTGNNGIEVGYSEAKKKMQSVNDVVKTIFSDKLKEPNKIIVIIHEHNHFVPFGSNEKQKNYNSDDVELNIKKQLIDQGQDSKILETKISEFSDKLNSNKDKKENLASNNEINELKSMLLEVDKYDSDSHFKMLTNNNFSITDLNEILETWLKRKIITLEVANNILEAFRLSKSNSSSNIKSAIPGNLKLGKKSNMKDSSKEDRI